MRLFVTGASGFIGSAVVTELQQAGHQVLGLARSDASAEKLRAAGADVLRGDLGDLDSLRSGATEADGVIHLAYVHDFTQMEAAAQTDAAAIEALGSALEGSGKPIAIASGTLGLTPGRVGTERDDPQAVHPRVANAPAIARARRPWRASAGGAALPRPCTAPHDHGFIAAYVQIARDRGVVRLRRRRPEPLERRTPRRRCRGLPPRGRAGTGGLRAARRGGGGDRRTRHRRGGRSGPRPARAVRPRRAGRRPLRVAGGLPRHRRPRIQHDHAGAARVEAERHLVCWRTSPPTTCEPQSGRCKDPAPTFGT